MEQQPQSSIDRIKTIVQKYHEFLSGQLLRRLTSLMEALADVQEEKCRPRIVRRISAVYQRLLLELIQSHYNTKQREEEFRRLLDSKGCTIDEPSLMEDVIDILVKLYKAGQDCADISFERSVLIRFIMKELGNSNVSVKHIGRTIQTLYRCSSFDIVKKDDKDVNELRLKQHLCDVTTLSLHCDEELIKIAQEHHIRLNPESWAYLLHKNHPDVSRMQSIMDKCHTAPAVTELEDTLHAFGDKYNISPYLIDLKAMQEHLRIALESSLVDMDLIYSLLDRLASFEDLYTLRRNRNCRQLK